MQVINNAGAPAPQSVAEPVVIQKKKSNTLCIIITTIVCLCVVIPIVIFAIMMATAAAAVTSIASNVDTAISVSTTSTTTTTTAQPGVPQPYMNICQPDSPVEFFTGGETWSIEEYPSMAQAEFGLSPTNNFYILSPNYFDEAGEFAPFDPYATSLSGYPSVPASDCKITLTPRNSNEKIYLTLGNLDRVFIPVSGVLLTDLTTDMTNCGENYISINGARKCGYIDSDLLTDGWIDDNGIFTSVEVGAAGESVELILKTDGSPFQFKFIVDTM